jgi:hypothetical protein
MPDVTFEKVLDAVRLLPAEERQRLRKWLAEEERKRASQTDNRASQPALRREREMRWLREHEAQFAGQWVALEGERLLSHGTDARKVYEEGRALAVNVPFMAYAESPDEAWMGGW